MAYYAICAYDLRYCGLHGMNYTGVIQAFSDGEAQAVAEEEAYEVIEGYPAIYQEIDYDVEVAFHDKRASEEEKNEYRELLIQEDIGYQIAVVDEDIAKKYSLQDLDEKCYELGYNEFVEEFCCAEL